MITDETDLNQSAGPGKFYALQDEYLWELSLEGTDEEAGDANALGWAGLLNGPFEHPQLATVVGAILLENDVGFVSSTTYTDRATLKAAWAKISETVETESEK